MKILYDHQIFSTQRYGGISRYYAMLHDGLNKLDSVSSKIAVLYSENEYIKGKSILLNNSIGRKLFSGRPRRLYRWNRRFTRLLIKTGGYDIFHPTYYDTAFLADNNKPFVLTIHDMAHEVYPHIFGDAEEVSTRKKDLIEKAAAIIAISNHTQQSILEFFPEAGGKISVVYHGYTIDASLTAKPLTVPDNFILFVGERDNYKNFLPFVQAIAPILVQNQQLHLVCTGAHAFNAEELNQLTKLDIAAQCIQLHATDAQLKYLYSKARLFVFPSIHEGFGFPILEAFANNCPVACSNNTALPEVAGNAAIYFDPLNKQSMREAVEQLLSDEGLRRKLIAEGHKRLQLFTPQACVENTLAVYQSVLKA